LGGVLKGKKGEKRGESCKGCPRRHKRQGMQIFLSGREKDDGRRRGRNSFFLVLGASEDAYPPGWGGKNSKEKINAQHTKRWIDC